MDVACVLDLQQPEHLAQRRRALEEVRQACNLVNANMHHIQVLFSNINTFAAKRFAGDSEHDTLKHTIISVRKTRLRRNKCARYILQCRRSCC